MGGTRRLGIVNPTNFELDKLKFPLMWYQKLCKAGRRITFVKVLSRKLSSSCILELSFLKNYANHLVHLLVVYTETNIAEELVLIQTQQFIPANVATLDTQRPRRRPKLPEHIHQARMERQAKQIFQMKVSKSEKQKCLAAGIQHAIIKANRGTKRRGADEQLQTSASLHVFIICIQIRFITFITFLITIWRCFVPISFGAHLILMQRYSSCYFCCSKRKQV